MYILSSQHTILANHYHFEMGIPTIEQFKKLDWHDQKDVLTQLFEKCLALETISHKVVSSHAYSSYEDLICAIFAELSLLLKQNQNDPKVYDIIAAHPRLGAAKKTNTLSEHSKAEQASLQHASEKEALQLQQLNEAYEKTFPGLRYVVFVNGRPRDEIMEDMMARIDRNDISLEKYEAFKAMCEIAIDRASKLQ